MRLVVFDAPGLGIGPGVLTRRGVVSVGELVGAVDSPTQAMLRLIDGFDALQPRLAQLAEAGQALALDAVTLLPPLPRPGKILCSTSGYGPRAGSETAAQPVTADPAPLLMTLKSAESVIGPRGTIVLPAVDDQWQFAPEAELGVVIRGPARSVAAADWRQLVFGYTCVLDVMARGDQQFGRDFWLAKADTLGPLGPCIVTADELPDPNALRVRSWLNGQPYQDYSTADADYGVPYQLEFATTVMTLYSGDVLACGSAPTAGLPPLKHGDTLAMEIDSIGRLELSVTAMAGTRR